MFRLRKHSEDFLPPLRRQNERPDCNQDCTESMEHEKIPIERSPLGNFDILQQGVEKFDLIFNFLIQKLSLGLQMHKLPCCVRNWGE